jgi:hypothetical protein
MKGLIEELWLSTQITRPEGIANTSYKKLQLVASLSFPGSYQSDKEWFVTYRSFPEPSCLHVLRVGGWVFLRRAARSIRV